MHWSHGVYRCSRQNFESKGLHNYKFTYTHWLSCYTFGELQFIQGDGYVQEGKIPSDNTGVYVIVYLPLVLLSMLTVKLLHK